jgi:hypothetical protein
LGISASTILGTVNIEVDDLDGTDYRHYHIDTIPACNTKGDFIVDCAAVDELTSGQRLLCLFVGTSEWKGQITENALALKPLDRKFEGDTLASGEIQSYTRVGIVWFHHDGHSGAVSDLGEVRRVTIL